MGKFDFEISGDFLKQLGKLADIDKHAPVMIDESMPILEASLRKELSGHRRTSQMLDSVKKTKSKRVRDGYYAVVRPTGKDKGGVRNMEKLAWLEYGTKNQPPRPILTKAIKDSEPAVLKKLEEVFRREVSK